MILKLIRKYSYQKINIVLFISDLEKISNIQYNVNLVLYGEETTNISILFSPITQTQLEYEKIDD